MRAIVARNLFHLALSMVVRTRYVGEPTQKPVPTVGQRANSRMFWRKLAGNTMTAEKNPALGGALAVHGRINKT